MHWSKKASLLALLLLGPASQKAFSELYLSPGDRGELAFTDIWLVLRK